MFQTEIIVFFQSVGSDLLTFFFKIITDFGRSNYTGTILIIIMFGINIRNGFIISWAVMWNGLLTDFFKNLFALPRPANVDSNVLLPGKDYPNPTTFKGMGAKSFFGEIPQNVIDQLRANRIDSWGFPSGHSSNAMTLWGTIFMMFKKKWIQIAAIFFIIFMPLSRMYLGRHFLADILGGIFLGLLITIGFMKIIYKNEKFMKFLFEKPKRFNLDIKNLSLISFLFLIPILLFFITNIKPENIARLLGLNLAFFIIRLRGFPNDAGTVLIRISRILITSFIFLGVQIALKELFSVIFIHETAILDCAIIFITFSVSMWISFEINLKLGFYSITNNSK